jgi:hypothetical protein
MDSNRMFVLLDEISVGLERAISAVSELESDAPWGSSPVIQEMLGDLCHSDGLTTHLWGWAYEQPGTDAWARRPERKKNEQ